MLPETVKLHLVNAVIDQNMSTGTTQYYTVHEQTKYCPYIFMLQSKNFLKRHVHKILKIVQDIIIKSKRCNGS